MKIKEIKIQLSTEYPQLNLQSLQRSGQISFICFFPEIEIEMAASQLLIKIFRSAIRIEKRAGSCLCVKIFCFETDSARQGIINNYFDLAVGGWSLPRCASSGGQHQQRQQMRHLNIMIIILQQMKFTEMNKIIFPQII